MGLGTVWMETENFTFSGLRTPDRLDPSESLYRPFCDITLAYFLCMCPLLKHNLLCPLLKALFNVPSPKSTISCALS
jgi:hypothetical protein